MKALATLGPLGHVKPAPGTWGSAAAIPMAWVLHGVGGFPALVVATVVLAVLGTWATRQYMAATGTHDPSEVIIDEVVGQWIALWTVSGGLWFAGADPWLFPWPGWVAAFVAFRVFDIWKPGPIGWADRRPDAWGVMLDDIIAGLFSAIVVAVLAALAHGVLMV